MLGVTKCFLQSPKLCGRVFSSTALGHLRCVCSRQVTGTLRAFGLSRVVYEKPSFLREVLWLYMAVYCHPVEAYERPPFIAVGVPRLPPRHALQTFPQGKSLVSVTVVGDPACSDADLEARVRSHLSEWFEAHGVEGGEGKGSVSASSTDVTKWRYLRTYRVPYAQPAQKPPVGEDGFYGRGVQVQRGIFLLRGTFLALSSNDGTLVHDIFRLCLQRRVRMFVIVQLVSKVHAVAFSVRA